MRGAHHNQWPSSLNDGIHSTQRPLEDAGRFCCKSRDALDSKPMTYKLVRMMVGTIISVLVRLLCVSNDHYICSDPEPIRVGSEEV